MGSLYLKKGIFISSQCNNLSHFKLGSFLFLEMVHPFSSVEVKLIKGAITCKNWESKSFTLYSIRWSM